MPDAGHLPLEAQHLHFFSLFSNPPCYGGGMGVDLFSPSCLCRAGGPALPDLLPASSLAAPPSHGLGLPSCSRRRLCGHPSRLLPMDLKSGVNLYQCLMKQKYSFYLITLFSYPPNPGHFQPRQFLGCCCSVPGFPGVRGLLTIALLPRSSDHSPESLDLHTD